MWVQKGNQTRWFTSFWISRFFSSATATTVGDIYLEPIFPFKNCTIEALGIYKTNNTANNTTYRLAIYNSDADGKPSDVLEEFGTVNINQVADGIRSVAGSATLEAGELYWLAIKADLVNTQTSTLACHNAGADIPQLWPVWGFDSTNFTAGFGTGSIGYAGLIRSLNAVHGAGSGAFPDLTSITPTVTNAQHPCVWFTYQYADSDEGGWAWHGAFPYWQVIDAAH